MERNRLSGGCGRRQRVATVPAPAGPLVGTVVGSSLTRPPAGWDITEPGSPLYVAAVNESVKGLNKNQADEPEKGEVCPDCGKIHAPVGGSQPNAARK